jgi:hypothetical protein
MFPHTCTTRIHQTYFSENAEILLQRSREVHNMSLDDYINNPLWHILLDTVHTLTMFRHHKAYVRDVVLVEQPQIGPEDLALRLGISLGESLVILYELQESKAENQK